METLKVYKKFVFAVITMSILLFQCGMLSAKTVYAALWFHPETKQLVEVCGDFHRSVFSQPGFGDYYSSVYHCARFNEDSLHQFEGLAPIFQGGNEPIVFLVEGLAPRGKKYVERARENISCNNNLKEIIKSFQSLIPVGNEKNIKLARMIVLDGASQVLPCYSILHYILFYWLLRYGKISNRSFYNINEQRLLDPDDASGSIKDFFEQTKKLLVRYMRESENPQAKEIFGDFIGARSCFYSDIFDRAPKSVLQVNSEFDKQRGFFKKAQMIQAGMSRDQVEKESRIWGIPVSQKELETCLTEQEKLVGKKVTWAQEAIDFWEGFFCGKGSFFDGKSKSDLSEMLCGISGVFQGMVEANALGYITKKGAAKKIMVFAGDAHIVKLEGYLARCGYKKVMFDDRTIGRRHCICDRDFKPVKSSVFKWILLSSEYVEKYFSVLNVASVVTSLKEKYPDLF